LTLIIRLRVRARRRVKIEPILKEVCFQAYPESAICVQRFDDSLNSAIRITYRISLRSSSLREPRYPLLRVVQRFVKISYLFRDEEND
jgi:hypothetical protein